MSTIVPGSLHPSNGRHVLAWNQQGVLAYGCHNLIFLVDACSQRRIQALEFHKTAISHISWSPPAALLSEDQTLRIASADISGRLVVSDPKNGTTLSTFGLPNTNVIHLEWFVWKDLQRDFLLVLHSPSLLVLWNADTGEKVWSFSFPMTFTGFSLDPFISDKAAFATANSIFVVSDIDLNVPPSGAGNIITLAENAENEIVCLRHHTAYQNILLLVTRNRVWCVHQELCCVIFKSDFESSLLSVLPIQSADAFIVTSTTGTCTLWVGKYLMAKERVDGQLLYERVAVGEGVRGTAVRGGAGLRAVASAICPATQSTVAFLYTNGRSYFYQLESDSISSSGLYRSVFAEELFTFDDELTTGTIDDLGFRQIGICNALAVGVTSVRVKPLEGMVKRDQETLQDESPLDDLHLAAIGTSGGTLHLVDVFTREIVKEFTVQSSPIKCIEWTSSHSVLTAGFNHPLSTTNAVRNDVILTDIRTGISRRARPEGDESPITMIRVSFYQSYVALAFEREPLEVWDLNSMRLLRRMSKACPLIRDMAWSCKHCTVKPTDRGGPSVYRENLVVLDSDNRLYHIVVKGLHVRDGKEVSTQWKSGGWAIRCMAWKGDVLALGDADGRLAVWDLAKRQSKNTRAGRTPVVRMQFSRLAGDHTLAVLYQNELILWETESLTRTQTISMDGCRAALDVDLCGVTPVLVTNDNMMWYATDAPNGLNMTKQCVIWGLNLEEIKQKFMAGEATSIAPLDSYFRRRFRKETSPEDALANELAWYQWRGDTALADVLRMILHKIGSEEKRLLPPHLQIFWSGPFFQEREKRVIRACCNIREADESRLVERAVVLGGEARRAAVDRLIGSAFGDVRLSSYKAALLVSNHDDEHSKSLIKLIATNLIANDLIQDGVELLFVVGAGADACRYLQSQRQWQRSAHYAKMGLEGVQGQRVLEKTAAFLSIDQRSTSLLWECSFGRWTTVKKLLSAAKFTHLADLLPEEEAPNGILPTE